MALRKNDALRNKQAIDLAALWDGGTIEIRTGTQPADPDSAASGTLLATINLPTPAMSVTGGVISKSGTWSGSAVATNTAGWARMINSGATRSLDMSVAESAADLIIDDDAVVSGGVVTVTSFTLTIPDGV